METVFKQVNYDLNTLISNIDQGSIGLPEIQRPFLWKNVKVRDLFDSMYKGYPVGNLLFWKNGSDSSRSIGTDRKQNPPNLVIVDGQQRLTSLYAVVKKKSVVRDNFNQERIRIAFNALEERFEVNDAAIERNKEFISDISRIWDPNFGLFSVVDEYLNGLRQVHEMTESTENRVKQALQKLASLLYFPFTALELEADISEEQVADVFVRINSKGISLNQADFILTLMSVFWDEGRTQLEKFCHKSRVPSQGQLSPYNNFIEPRPDQLLRVDVGVAFKRARLQHVYSILRGKDLETEKFSVEQREEQFRTLMNAQNIVLNIRYWQDFLNCIRVAGFRSKKMISSENSLLFSYILYLIGRTELGVEEHSLRKIIAQWFFMSSLTGRFTGSPESQMEFDLAMLRNIYDAQSFVEKLQQICSITLTDDFWNVTLPNNLATASPRSPSLYAYNAAQVILDAPILYSTLKMDSILSSGIHSQNYQVHRHHLFPKEYLATLNITSVRETNQNANYAYVEYLDNIDISSCAPVEYVPKYSERFSDSELTEMNRLHALPENWQQMPYEIFLHERRKLQARTIRQGYEELTLNSDTVEIQENLVDVQQIINSGESDTVEYKSTLRINLHTGKVDKQIQFAALKTMAAFLNTHGGVVIIGVSDDGDPLGIQNDNFANEDEMARQLTSLVKSRMGNATMVNVQFHFEEIDDQRVLVVHCKRSPSPVYVNSDKGSDVYHFFIRTGPSTTEISGPDLTNYISQKFS